MKSLISTAVGLGLSIFLQWLILPLLLGVPVPLVANLSFAAIMTAVSVARGYLLERFFEWMGWPIRLSPFMHAVLFECKRQREQEGYSAEHDDSMPVGDLAAAGAVYALEGRSTLIETPRGMQSVTGRIFWPWPVAHLNPKDFRKNQIRGAALIIAEGDKFDRARKSSRRQAHA